MSESNAFVAGGGGFIRVRDSSNGFSAEINRQKKLEADRLAKQQAEHDRREALRADEESKRKASRDADAAKAFREYHNNPASRGGVGSIHDYCQARFGHCYSTDLKQALAELNDLSFMQRYYPERANAKAWAADVKPIYVARCKFCRGCYRTEEELAEHQRTTKPCPKCRSVCSSGGEVHRCSVYGGPVIEDRVPEVKYEEIGEE